MFRAHVLIIRRSKLHYTASGIITSRIGGRLVHRLREDWLTMNAALEGVSGQQHAPAALYPRERPGTHFT